MPHVQCMGGGSVALQPQALPARSRCARQARSAAARTTQADTARAGRRRCQRIGKHKPRPAGPPIRAGRQGGDSLVAMGGGNQLILAMSLHCMGGSAPPGRWVQGGAAALWQEGEEASVCAGWKQVFAPRCMLGQPCARLGVARPAAAGCWEGRSRPGAHCTIESVAAEGCWGAAQLLPLGAEGIVRLLG